MTSCTGDSPSRRIVLQAIYSAWHVVCRARSLGGDRESERDRRLRVIDGAVSLCQLCDTVPSRQFTLSRHGVAWVRNSRATVWQVPAAETWVANAAHSCDRGLITQPWSVCSRPPLYRTTWQLRTKWLLTTGAVVFCMTNCTNEPENTPWTSRNVSAVIWMSLIGCCIVWTHTDLCTVNGHSGYCNHGN